LKRDILNEEEVKNRIREFRHCCKACEKKRELIISETNVEH
jgi:hypothetical protein